MAAEPTVIRGACPHDCPDTCAWEVTVRDGVAEKLVGVKEHPFTRGGLCAKVSHFLERTYSPDRLRHPLIRTGPKGEGAFERALVGRGARAHRRAPSAIVAEHGGEAVLPYSFSGTQGLVQGASMDRRFFARLGACRLERTICGQAAAAGQLEAAGTLVGLRPDDLAHSRFIVLWGTNTIVTNLHQWPIVQAARKAGARVVVIDPLRTRTAAAADWHVRPLPGHRRRAGARADARDRGRGPARRRVRRRPHGGLRAPRGRARAVAARAHAGGHRRARRGGRRARPRLRHHAPGRHPPADRHRAPPRGRADGAHHRVPARADRGVARSRRRHPRPDRVGRLQPARPERARRPATRHRGA